jgi:formylglycine-generating enzyme required for sulfatase activity
MELLQLLTAVVISLSVLLFFGPVIVLVSIIGSVNLRVLQVDLTRLSKPTRAFIAVFGFVVWLLVYIPLIYFSYTFLSGRLGPTPTVVAGVKTSTVEVSTIIPKATNTDITPTKIPSQTPTPEKATPIPTPSILVILIPESDFWMGEDGIPNRDFNPSHEIFLDDFYIDKFEVSNLNYSLCVQANDCELPSTLKSNTRNSYFDNPTYSNYPVIYIEWEDAQNYCEWVGGSLPSEAQWEKAARWSPSNKFLYNYPWGDQSPDQSFANYNSNDTIPIGKLPQGASRTGVMDMSGNVEEWVKDYYNPDYYRNSTARNPVENRFSPLGRVTRGGSWASKDRWGVRVFMRYYEDPEKSQPYLGFRCAYDKQP